MTQLSMVYDQMHCAPYDKHKDGLEKAYEACLENRVRVTNDPAVIEVQSAQKAEGWYEVRGGRCTCPYAQNHPKEEYGCYHPIAARLYLRWQQALAPLIPPHKEIPVETATPTETPPSTPPVGEQPPLRPDTALLATLATSRRSISAIVADLSKPLPSACMATKTAKNRKTGAVATIAFLHWHTVARLLDAYAPGWSGEVVRLEQVGKACIMTYRLTIPCLEGAVSRDATGQEDEDVDDYGDPTSNAEAMAFKRAAAKFGIGLYLYEKDQTGAALTQLLKDERTSALAELGKAIGESGMSREATRTWFRTHTGVTRTDELPLWAIPALTAQLRSCHTTPGVIVAPRSV
jgi:hypothetical protein